MGSEVDAERIRELDAEKAGRLEGIWVPSGIVERLSLPPTPLTLDLVLEDTLLLSEALDHRGESLPRLSRQLVRVAGHVYQAAVPLIRALRKIAPLDAELATLLFAAEARRAASSLLPARLDVSRVASTKLVPRIKGRLPAIEARVLAQEQDGAQHYRWLVEMDLGILPDDALETTIEECVAIERRTRRLEIEVSVELVEVLAAVAALSQRAEAAPPELALPALILPDLLEFASATPASALGSSAQATGRLDGSAVAADFLAGFGERGPNERELLSPRWRERPEELERLVALLVQQGSSQCSEEHEQRRISARRDRQALSERVLTGLARRDQVALRTLRELSQGLLRMRSRLHLVRARALSMLRTATLDLDRRLLRLIGSPAGSAFFLSLRELLAVARRPEPELSRRAAERRHAWSSWLERPAPPVVLGRASRPSGGFELERAGIGFGGPEVRGRATVAQRFDHALGLTPGGILVVRALDPGFAPLLPVAGAVVAESGSLLDEGVLVALTLGVPLVIGAAGATQEFRSGDSIAVLPAAGKLARV
jgi:phosphohistidine swiveling domain-containing protein